MLQWFTMKSFPSRWLPKKLWQDRLWTNGSPLHRKVLHWLLSAKQWTAYLLWDRHKAHNRVKHLREGMSERERERERDRMTKRWSLLNWFSVWTGDGTHKHTQTIPNRDTGWSNLVQLQQPLQQAERVGYEPTTYWALLYTKQLRVDVTNKFQHS